MRTAVIIPAAGLGIRLSGKTKKQFLILNDKPILVHTIEKFQNSSAIDEIIIVTTNDEIPFVKSEIVNKYRLSKVKKVLLGGEHRQDSVYEGVKAIDSSTDFVLVHDGVRPFITTSKINGLIAQCKKNKAVILAVRPKETVKLNSVEGFIDHTLNRDQLWLAQTPQAFEFSILKSAFKRAYNDKFYGTDEASLVERIGVKVAIMNGDYQNIKITTQEDINISNAIFKNLME